MTVYLKNLKKVWCILELVKYFALSKSFHSHSEGLYCEMEKSLMNEQLTDFTNLSFADIIESI